MIPKTQLLIYIGIGLMVLIGAGFIFSKNQNYQLPDIENKIIYFYSVSCPHCANVNQFFEENDVESKVNFEKKEVDNNKENINLLLAIAKKCGISRNKTGVPFLWDGSKCIVGDVDIINFFQQKIQEL